MNHDFDYGPDAAVLDMTEEDFNLNASKKLEELRIVSFTTQEITNLEKKTIGQHDNVHWHEFMICRKSTTSCHNLVKTLLFQST